MEDYMNVDAEIWCYSGELDSTRVLKELSVIFAKIIPGWQPVYRSKNIQNLDSRPRTED